MKNKVLKFSILTAALLLPGWVSGQEMVKMLEQKTNFTLARDWKSYKKWVICNNREGEFSFATMDTSGLNRLVMRTGQSFYVKDMEMSSDTLFFCGSMLDSATLSQRGVLGFFTASAMPTPTVRYIMFSDMTSLNKIKYYTKYSTKHVVMIGTGTDSVDYIVDAYRNFGTGGINPGNWNLNKTRITDFEAKFDDIAVIEEDVVVSARVFGLINRAYLCYIEKTPLVNVPFYQSSSFKIKELYGSPSGEVLLQSGINDTLFAVYSRRNNISICQFKRYYNIASRSFSIEPTIIPYYATIRGKVLDVCMDSQKRNLNILLSRYETAGDSTQQIIHIPTAQMMTGGFINSHSYNNGYHPMSLCRSLTNTTVTVGEYMGERMGKIWSVSLIHNNTTGNCTTMPSYLLYEMPLQLDDPVTNYHTDQWVTKQIKIMPVTALSPAMTTICD